MGAEFEATGNNPEAPFTLRVRRGEGMSLLSMNWRRGRPPADFVGFAIECKPPGEPSFYPLKNRLSFMDAEGKIDPEGGPSTEHPFQKFRWVHFPYDAEVDGEFEYRVTPVHMDGNGKLSNGEPQAAAIVLGGDTYPDKLNVCFTRGFVSSQAFVDECGDVSNLLPAKAAEGLTFKPTHPKAAEAFNWMGFEARRAILDLLDRAIADKKAQVRVVAYDFNLPEIVEPLEKLKGRVKVIIDNAGEHGHSDSAETAAQKRLEASAGAGSVLRQRMGNLQHNKTIAVDGPDVQAVVCGSTNLSWRGFYVQSNNAVVVHGEAPVKEFMRAFDDYWEHGTPAGFGATEAAGFNSLGVPGLDATIGFSPHTADNALLLKIADDIATTRSSLLYSLAFLYQTPGPILNAIKQVTEDESIFVYGISDRKVGGLELQKPSGERAPVYPSALSGNVPQPFKREPTGGGGARMHHKFLVVDFNTAAARVYLGSYNFSATADTENGENMVLIKDPRVAASYATEALRIFDHYHYRVSRSQANEPADLALAKPPSGPGEKPWWDEYYSDPVKLQDRKVFA